MAVSENPDLRAVQEAALEHGIFKSCLNCEEWVADKCGKYQAVPPPKVVYFGCQEWSFNIPF